MLHNPVLSQRIIMILSAIGELGITVTGQVLLADVDCECKPYRNSNGELKVRVVSGCIIFLVFMLMNQHKISGVLQPLLWRKWLTTTPEIFLFIGALLFSISFLLPWF